MKNNVFVSFLSLFLLATASVNAFAQDQYVQIKKGYVDDGRTLKEKVENKGIKNGTLSSGQESQNGDEYDKLLKKELPTKTEVAKQIANSMKAVKPGKKKLFPSMPKFNISATEITQAQWEAIMGYNPSIHVGADLPVENVTWSQCQDFIKMLNKLTGKKYRLPTVKEWQYAANGGQNSKEYKYSGSDQIAEVAWYKTNSDGATHRVGKLKKNEIALYDMNGNVAEWCSDAAGSSHAYVGGSFADEASKCTATSPKSSILYSDEASPRIGFRLAE